MINNREKNGNVSIDWRETMLGKKHERKTIGFGNYDKKSKEWDEEMHIRELSLATGGLGCALWDGGVVLARWIYNNYSIFYGKTVHELGSGCGLSGIVCARYAKHVTMSDYIEQVVDNIRYNIKLNSRDDDDDEKIIESEDGRIRKMNISENTKAGYLDWDAVASGKVADQDEGEKCTCKEHGRTFVEQEWYHCTACYKDPASGCCRVCAQACHKGHTLQGPHKSKFRCDCFTEGEETCVFRRPVSLPVEPVDILIGAELTYSLLSVDSLLKVVELYLKEDGVFYEVLSEDRDGVSVFCERARERGFRVEINPVSESYMGQYNTRKWTFQNTEKYRFYSFHRPASQHPTMK
eukprot:Colp12_sorted_trinity150504_noHs@19596